MDELTFGIWDMFLYELEIFYEAILCISSSYYVTSTMYMFEAFGIGMKIKEMSTSKGVNMSVRMMVVHMKEK